MVEIQVETNPKASRTNRPASLHRIYPEKFQLFKKAEYVKERPKTT